MPDDDVNTPGPEDPNGEQQGEGEDDPRPVFEGDWRTATGEEKGRHSERVRQWKLRHPESADATTPQEERDGSTGSVAPTAPPDSDDPLDVLRYWSQHATLPSDRIRAATELARAERAREEERTDEVMLWLARRDTLLTLPPAQRLDWLLGQMRDEEEGGDTATDEEDDEEGHDILPP